MTGRAPFTIYILVVVFLAAFFMLCTMLPSLPLTALGEENGRTSPVRLLDSQDKYPLSGFFDYLEDPSGQLTVEQVSSKKFAKFFVASHEEIPNFGYTPSAYWARITLEYAADLAGAEKEWLLEVGYFLFDEVTFYFPKPFSGFVVKQAGDRIGFNQREVPFRHPVFRIKTRAAEPATVYLRIRSQGPVQIPLVLWSVPAYSLKAWEENYFFGIFFGVMIIMVCYNLFLFFSIKDRDYLYYVFYILGLTLLFATLNGFSFQYLWPSFPWWANQNLIFFMGWVQIAAAMFARSFLRTKKYSPTLGKILFLFIIQGIISMAAALFGLYDGVLLITNLGALAQAVFMFSTGVVCVKKGYRPARFFTLAFVNFLLGGTVSTLFSFGLFPSVFITTYGIQMGTVLEVTLLAFGLADRINLERKDKVAAQKDALEAQALVVDELKEVDRLKDTFLASTSHELRTPLHGIIGIAESLMGGAVEKLPPKAAENLALIVQSGKRLTHLINDILDFSRLKDRDIKLNLRPVDVRTLAQTILTVSRPMLGEKPVRLVNKIPDNMPSVRADEDRLQQILYNLVGNAVKFTSKGEIAVYAKQLASMVQIEVSDTGTGIPADKIDRIFQSFEQADDSDSRSAGGTGLGLTITRWLVELHGGKIWLESEKGMGSTFRFTLPVGKTPLVETDRGREQIFPIYEPAPHPTPMPPLIPEDEQAPASKQSRILVVDDDPVNLQIVANHFKGQNILLFFACNGKAALEFMENNQMPDLVLLDIMMPGMTGYRVCRALREKYSASELPVVLLTAKNRVTDLVEGFESGANDYLVKPFTKDELLSRTRFHLKIGQAHQTLSENLKLKRELALRKGTERELKRINGRLASVLGQASDGIVAVNQEAEISFCNRSFENRSGYGAQGLLGRSHQILFDGTTRRQIEQSLIRMQREKLKPGVSVQVKNAGLRKKDQSVLSGLLTLIPLNMEDEHLLVLIFSDPEQKKAGKVPHPVSDSIIDLTRELSQNRGRLQTLEESLTPHIIARYPDVADHLQAIDSALDRMGKTLLEGRNLETERSLAVTVINLAIAYWTEATGASKAELASKSGLWKVYVNKNGHERTQTLDRYLNMKTLPQRFRWNLIVQTAEFVLSACDTPSGSRSVLEASLAELRMVN